MESISIEAVRKYFVEFGMEGRIQEFETSSATVTLAAEELYCEEERIAKTLAFQKDEEVILIVVAGDRKIDNRKFKNSFQKRARMVAFDEVQKAVGHAAGGVCPFAVNEGVKIYLDTSLQKFVTVFPACGSSNSAIELTIDELARYANSLAWVDVCKEDE